MLKQISFAAIFFTLRGGQAILCRSMPGPVCIGPNKAPVVCSSPEQANSPNASVIGNIVSISQAEYDAAEKDPNTLYVISAE